MSWWIYLQDSNTGENVEVPPHKEGGTFALGGTREGEINVTYNYGKWFAFRELNKMQASETIPRLKQAMEELGIDTDRDYWKPTKGNVGYTCGILLRWAEMNPEAVWKVS